MVLLISVKGRRREDGGRRQWVLLFGRLVGGWGVLLTA